MSGCDSDRFPDVIESVLRPGRESMRIGGILVCASVRKARLNGHENGSEPVVDRQSRKSIDQLKVDVLRFVGQGGAHLIVFGENWSIFDFALRRCGCRRAARALG
jgi:hypothetical protein